MNRYVTVFLTATLIGLALVALAYAGEATSKDKALHEAPAAQAPAANTLQGEVLTIDGDFYVVKDQSGKEVRLHIDKSTKMSGTIEQGARVSAEISNSGHAISLNPLDK
jgi:uncharacterized protein YdeI (BOF family)